MKKNKSQFKKIGVIEQNFSEVGSDKKTDDLKITEYNDESLTIKRDETGESSSDPNTNNLDDIIKVNLNLHTTDKRKVNKLFIFKIISYLFIVIVIITLLVVLIIKNT